MKLFPIWLIKTKNNWSTMVKKKISLNILEDENIFQHEQMYVYS